MTGYGVGFPPDVDQDLVKEVDKIILELQEEGNRLKNVMFIFSVFQNVQQIYSHVTRLRFYN